MRRVGTRLGLAHILGAVFLTGLGYWLNISRYPINNVQGPTCQMMSKDLSNVNDDHYGDVTPSVCMLMVMTRAGAGKEVVTGTERHNLHSVVGRAGFWYWDSP